MIGVIACGDEGDGTQFCTDPKCAETPTGEASLTSLPDKDVEIALVKTRDEINKARPVGIATYINLLKAELAAQKIGTTEIEQITDSYMFPKDSKGNVTGRPIVASSGSSSPSSEDGIGSANQGLNKNEYSKYYTCPLLAPESTASTTCTQMASLVAAKVKAALDQNKTQVAADIAKTYSDLSTTAQQFITAWAQTALQYGSDIATIYATHELQSAAKCDTSATANEVSYSLGVTQGVAIVQSMRAWALSQVTSCTVNTDLIATQVKNMSLAKVSAYMKENKICKDNDISDTTAAFKNAEIQRESGIKVGISNQVQVLRNELFQARQSAPCGGGGGGEPLVIDLDGDGLNLSANRVRFDLMGDGASVATTWVGAREGLLALDRNNNGRIDSVGELMGNQSDCSGSLCYDGIDALAALDSNSDGVVDSRDAAFSRLMVWVDGDQDGVSQPGELFSLADRGIRAFKVSGAQDMMVQHTAGTVTRTLEVVTDRGVRTAYDVWFRVQLGTANLAGLAPR